MRDGPPRHGSGGLTKACWLQDHHLPAPLLKQQARAHPTFTHTEHALMQTIRARAWVHTETSCRAKVFSRAFTDWGGSQKPVAEECGRETAGGTPDSSRREQAQLRDGARKHQVAACAEQLDEALTLGAGARQGDSTLGLYARTHDVLGLPAPGDGHVRVEEGRETMALDRGRCHGAAAEVSNIILSSRARYAAPVSVVQMSAEMLVLARRCSLAYLPRLPHPPTRRPKPISSSWSW